MVSAGEFIDARGGRTGFGDWERLADSSDLDEPSWEEGPRAEGEDGRVLPRTLERELKDCSNGLGSKLKSERVCRRAAAFWIGWGCGLEVGGGDVLIFSEIGDDKAGTGNDVTWQVEIVRHLYYGLACSKAIAAGTPRVSAKSDL